MPLPVVQPRPSGDKNQESTGKGLEASCPYTFVALRGVSHGAKDKLLGALLCRQTGVAAADSAGLQVLVPTLPGTRLMWRPIKPRFTALKSTDPSQKAALLKDPLGAQVSCQILSDTGIVLGRLIVSVNFLSPRSD